VSLRQHVRDGVVALLPRRSRVVHRLAVKLVNLYNNDNEFDMARNGELRLARRALPHARVAFDIGANSGDWTASALEINPALEVHAFEPSRATFQILSARPFPPNVHRNAFGLGDAAEERELFVYEDGSGANALYRRRGLAHQPAKSERVSLRTFDDYCREAAVDRVDFAKIDVEGHELTVLRGARGMLAAGAVGVVQFEYGGCYIDSRTLLKDIWELLEEINPAYAFYKIHPRELRPAPAYRQAFETFQYSNWVLVHPDWKRLVA
jgi:FkbM family methyltransferase